jgi:hypothetical protein
MLPVELIEGVTGNSEQVGLPSGVSIEQPGPARAEDGKSRNEFSNLILLPPTQGLPLTGVHLELASLVSRPAITSIVKENCLQANAKKNLVLGRPLCLGFP